MTPRHALPAQQRFSRTQLVAAGAAVLLVVAAVVGFLVWPSDETTTESAVAPAPTADPEALPTPQPTATPAPTPTPIPTPTPTPTPFLGLVDPASVGQPYSTTVEGLLTFRGNPTRTYYGKGPVPQNPQIAWRYPEATTMCGPTTLGGEEEWWCGTGWTGQPAVVERENATWVVFGAYDHNVHFVDASTGADLMAPFPTNDIIKGSVTIDPDGYPLVYSGSRDDYFHVIAIDRDDPTELWALNADDIPGAKWNNDWDGSALILDDYLIEGGENSVFHVVKLNRGYDANGLVTVDPSVVFTAPGYDDELLAAVGGNVSIENSVAISGDIAYFANSGGLVQGWDLSGLSTGEEPERVFRYWAGDDVDASVVVDEDGYLYVGVEYERGNARSREVGQLIKLDPTADEPLVWSVADNDRLPAGVWATAAIHQDLIIVGTDSGRLLGVDRANGEIRWEVRLTGPIWSSPVVVDDVLIQADCAGNVNGFDLSDTSVEPTLLWRVNLGSCIESTPAVWDGRIIVGARGGQVYMLADVG